MSQCTPRPRGEGPATFDNRDAVDKQVHDAGAVLKRFQVRRMIGDLGRIEDDDVGEVTRAKQTPIEQAHFRGIE